YNLAIADLSKAIELNPDYALAYYNRGNTYYRKKQADLAIADYNKVLEMSNDADLVEAAKQRIEELTDK
ncbi:MAG: tetratricopeptide repeat protein, partial [Dehalococcoidia bacterium]